MSPGFATGGRTASWHRFGTIPSQTRAEFLDTIASGRRSGEPNYRTKCEAGGGRARVGLSGAEWQRRADELAVSLQRGEIDEDRWFAGMTEIFDGAYLAGENPRAQSGFGGDEARWEAARRPIADVVDGDGTFLDVGCASGHLLECLARWTPHHIEPYGLDLSPRLADLARRRLPHLADRIYVGNALTWEPPHRFDLVRTELVYVPAARERELIERLLADLVAPRGRLILCGYGSPRSGVVLDPVGAKARSHGFEPELELQGEAPEGGPIVELAVLRAA